MSTGVSLLERFRQLLAERVEYGTWTHEHCDEDSGGNHHFDSDSWERDVLALLDESDPRADVSQ